MVPHLCLICPAILQPNRDQFKYTIENVDKEKWYIARRLGWASVKRQLLLTLNFLEVNTTLLRLAVDTLEASLLLARLVCFPSFLDLEARTDFTPLRWVNTFR